jgi:hypothetical protein
VQPLRYSDAADDRAAMHPLRFNQTVPHDEASIRLRELEEQKILRGLEESTQLELLGQGELRRRCAVMTLVGLSCT